MMRTKPSYYSKKEGKYIMLSVAKDWNPKQALLKSLIGNKDKFEDAMTLLLELHAMIHSSLMSGIAAQTYEDELWEGFDEEAFKTMPTDKDVTIAWNLWHITRIEDLTSNILIAGTSQVMNDNWTAKMKVKVYDTGNAMSDEEILDLSSSINIEELKNYRIAVGRKTREIIGQLKPEHLKKKVEPKGLQRVLDEGGVLDVEDSRWLLDFWGKKNIAQLLLMPTTRHQIVHINDSLRLKEKCMKKINK